MRLNFHDFQRNCGLEVLKFCPKWLETKEHAPLIYLDYSPSLLAEVSDSEKRERPLPAPDEFSVAHVLAFSGN